MKDTNLVRIIGDFEVDDDYNEILIANEILEQIEKYVKSKFPRRVKTLDLTYDVKEVYDDYRVDIFE